MIIVNRKAVLLVFVLAALASPAHAAEEHFEGTQVALGLGALDRGVGLWLVRPKTMVGVEFDRLEYSRDELYFYDHYIDEDKIFSSYHVRGSLTVQRIFSKGPLFQVGYLAYNHISLQVQKRTNIQGGGGSFEAGWGILYRPLKKVSVLLRQGFALELYEESHVEFPYWPGGHIVRETDSLILRMQKARLLVLIHF